MPVLSPIPPRDLFETLRELGFDVIDETSTGWLLADASDPTSEPILVPKHGDEVTPDVMGSLQGRSQRVGRAVLDAIRRYQERQLARLATHPNRALPCPHASLAPAAPGSARVLRPRGEPGAGRCGRGRGRCGR